MIKTCEQCHLPFTPLRQKGNKQRFCSRACWIASLSRQVERICETCGKTFSVHAARGNARFCSFACRRTGQVKTCHNCGATFYVKPSHADLKDTCSRRCATQLRGKDHRSPMQGHAQTPEARQHVSAGLQAYFNGDPTKHWNYQGGQFTQKRGPSWKEQQLAARQRDGFACRVCGVTEQQLGKKLAVHHIVSYRRFSSHNEANALDNLVSACQSCHMKLEHGTATIPTE
jgi:hypothetical protein